MKGHPLYPKGMAVSAVHFQVHAGMPEVQAAARARGWNAGDVAAEPAEVHYSMDGWKTSRVVRASDQPPPFSPDGLLFLPGVQHSTPVEFAIKVSVRPTGAAQAEPAEVWLNNGGQNYRQATR